MILVRPVIRFFLLMLSGICLVGALWGGLVRLGWWGFSPLIGSLPGVHGPLIVCGFLGTFFSLERAETFKNPGGYFAPFLTALGALVLVLWPMSKVGPLLVASGSLAFFLVCLIILVRKFTLFSVFIFLGSFQWLMGNLIWLAQWPVYNVTLWWMSFVVLTTAGERLEIAQMMHVNVRIKTVLLLGLSAVFIGHILAAVGHITGPDTLMALDNYSIVDPRVKLGMQVAGIGMVTAATWFLIYDPARTRLRNAGLGGYIAFCMLSGYVWLALSGVFSFIFSGVVSGYLYDMFIHAFFLGFLMFMVFGHGPVLLPSMLGLFLTMRKYFFAGPIFLHVSLLLRIIGDTTDSGPLRRWGGMLGAVAIAYFMGTLFHAMFVDNRPDLQFKLSRKFKAG